MSNYNKTKGYRDYVLNHEQAHDALDFVRDALNHRTLEAMLDDELQTLDE
jgi:hypothetical protein